MAQDVLVFRKYADLAYGQLHLRVAQPAVPSDKPPLICFHMSPNSGLTFDRLIRVIGTDRTAIAPDTPGFGYSDPPEQPPEIADYARTFLEMLDVVGIEGPVDVLGYHTGSMTCAEIARLAPDRIRRAMLISAPVFDDEAREYHRNHYAHREPMADGSHLSEFWKEMIYWHELAGSGISEVIRHFPEALLGGENDWWGHRAAFNFVMEEVLPEVAQPILVFNPNDDLNDFTKAAAPFLRNGRILDVPGWGHGFLDRFPGEAAQLMRSFLDAPADAPFDAIDFVESARASWPTGIERVA